MRPRPRIVPWVRPVPQVYRPGRRVSPKRVPGIWTLRLDNLADRLRAFFWRHKRLEALAISIVMALLGFFFAWLAFS